MRTLARSRSRSNASDVAGLPKRGEELCIMPAAGVARTKSGSSLYWPGSTLACAAMGSGRCLAARPC